MGYGDELVASGLARGARERGERIAFGLDGKIRWTRQSYEIFRGNPNVAAPGEEGASDLRWIAHCPGKRLNTSGRDHQRWHWLPFRPPAGEIFFDNEEARFGASFGQDFIVIEPRVKPIYPNKQWPQERYRTVAGMLMDRGLRVVQFKGAAAPVAGCGEVIETPSFRKALAVLRNAALYIGAEGGLHHGAAAVGTKAVVIFGGWPDPRSSGYDEHRNLAAADAGCGTLARCRHCMNAMQSISVDKVFEAALGELA